MPTIFSYVVSFGDNNFTAVSVTLASFGSTGLTPMYACPVASITPPWPPTADKYKAGIKNYVHVLTGHGKKERQLVLDYYNLTLHYLW